MRSAIISSLTLPVRTTPTAANKTPPLSPLSESIQPATGSLMVGVTIDGLRIAVGNEVHSSLIIFSAKFLVNV